MLEIVRYDAESGACIVAAGFGERSDWVRNVSHDPHITLIVERQSRTGLAKRLDPDTAGREPVAYSRQHPIA